MIALTNVTTGIISQHGQRCEYSNLLLARFTVLKLDHLTNVSLGLVNVCRLHLVVLNITRGWLHIERSHSFLLQIGQSGNEWLHN